MKLTNSHSISPTKPTARSGDHNENRSQQSLRRFLPLRAALKRLAELKLVKLYTEEIDGFSFFYTTEEHAESRIGPPYQWDRSDPDLATVVEELGSLAGDGSSELVIRTLDAGQQYRICEYDGKEWLEFPSDIKWETAA